MKALLKNIYVGWIGTPTGVAFVAASIFLGVMCKGDSRVAPTFAADRLPRPYCVPAEPHIQLFANPPIAPAYLFAWRKDDPSVALLIARTGMTAQCYAVTKSQVENVGNGGDRSIRWDDGICVRLSSPDGSIYVEGCN